MKADAVAFDTIVVGAGVLGVATAFVLASQGARVALIEQAEPAHSGGASGDHTRILRAGYGGSEWHSHSAWRGLQQWLEVERRYGEQIIIRTGVLWLIGSDTSWADATEHVLRHLNIPVRKLEERHVASLFPEINTAGATGLFEPDGSVIKAATAVHALVALAIGEGATLIKGRALPSAAGVELNGEVVSASNVVWACGGWSKNLLGLDQLRVTKQDVFYFSPPNTWGVESVPAWIDSRAAMYGTGAVTRAGVKAASSEQGPPTDPDNSDRKTSDDLERHVTEYLKSRFPALAPTLCIERHVCQYALTSDTDFIVDYVPKWPGHLVLSGDSGHAFKHAIGLAGHVAEVLVSGRASPQFALAKTRNSSQGLRVSPTKEGDFGL